MSSDEGSEMPTFGADESGADEPIERPPQEMVQADQQPAAEESSSTLASASISASPSTLWNRRTFFKSAALGTAAAAMYEAGGAVFSPLRVYANDLSNSPCTANDVQIIGAGVIQNEDCPCTGTFDAVVRFTVRNITGTERYCVALHFVPNEDGFDPGDVILRTGEDGVSGTSTVPRNSDTFMYGLIENYPCGAGFQCFGQPGVTRGKCAPGTCSTIAWNTSPNAANCETADQTPPGGQCRHQQICIRGRGETVLDCDASTVAVESVCAVGCGGTTTVRLCTTSDAELGPFTFVLSDGQTFGPSAVQCHNFLVGPITETTEITGTVTDAEGCATSDTITLTVNPLSAGITVDGVDNCDGVLTLNASVVNGNACTFAWTEGDEELGTGSSLQYGPVLDGACHTITVTADCDGCPASDSVTISQCVTTTTPC